MTRLARLLLVVLLAMPLQAFGQTIPIKTVPVAEGSQFLLYPSRNIGMGGVSIALDDPHFDPFVNPAKGVNVSGFHFEASPTYYGFSSSAGPDEGSGRTLPVGMLMRSDRLFLGGSVAWQELVMPGARATSPQNLYGIGMAGFEIPGTRLAVGVSASGARLEGMEGVRLLYADGNRVNQEGGMALYRFGLLHQWEEGRAADLVVAHHRFEMKHEISPQAWTNSWAPATEARTEQDETRGWAVQMGYRYPLSSGVMIGTQLTGDWKWHPKIPNYDLMQIPRDPGNSSAYRMGVGMSRSYGQAVLGIDLIYEPIWSHTWADAAEDTAAVNGALIPAGEMTVENFFRFNNLHLRMGMHRTGEQFDFLLGLNVHAIRYWLEQENFLRLQKREQQERWAEWTLSAGAGWTLPEFQVRYLGLLTLGTGQPGVQASWGGVMGTRQFAALSGDFLVAPSGELTLRETMVFTHQISVLVPLGGR